MKRRPVRGILLQCCNNINAFCRLCPPTDEVSGKSGRTQHHEIVKNSKSKTTRQQSLHVRNSDAGMWRSTVPRMRAKHSAAAIAMHSASVIESISGKKMQRGAKSRKFGRGYAWSLANAFLNFSFGTIRRCSTIRHAVACTDEQKEGLNCACDIFSRLQFHHASVTCRIKHRKEQQSR